jgi:hypothetical protein
MTDINAPIVFSVNDAAIAEVAEEFKEIDAYKDLDEAKAAKKILTKMRTTLAEAHKEAKAEALAYGRRCDAEKNRLLEQIKAIEDPITEQLNEIKQAEERKEQERLDKIQAAIERIEAHAADRYSLTLDELAERQSSLEAIEITEEVFQELTERAGLTKQDVAMKLRLAVDAEENRIKEEAEKERIEAENRELREKLAKQEAAERERREKEEAERREREAEEKRKADIKAEAERKAREKAEEEARQLREEKEERERKEREERERKEAEERAAAQAPDREKLLTFASKVDQLIKDKPTLDTDAGNEVMLQAIAMLIEVAHDIRTMTEEMK